MLTTADYLFAETVYVAFRSTDPKLDTMVQVAVKLQEHNIDSRMLLIAHTHCFQ